ncbi:hypothetical protein EDD86DRAFT_252423, partial [Gorgonomyces haynaldii]
RITFWKAPVLVTKYFCLYILSALADTITLLINHLLVVFVFTSVLLGLVYLYITPGSHQPWIQVLESQVIYYGWWIGLGVLSSIGLGTGLHTFLLFLGPFIAQVTITAYQCQSIDFATTGLDAFVCGPTTPVSIYYIWTKVVKETMFWGLGTAIGELPPYFVARAAALAGQDDPEFESIEKLKDKPKLTLFERAQVIMEQIVKDMGFIGILFLASIPNPLFDLAGIFCGHFNISFGTFFGATLIGKALIKCNIQAVSIVILFSKDILDTILQIIGTKIPFLHAIIVGSLEKQTRQFTQKGETPSGTSFVSLVWNTFLTLTIVYFLISIVESTALTYMKKLKKQD